MVLELQCRIGHRSSLKYPTFFSDLHNFSSFTCVGFTVFFLAASLGCQYFLNSQSATRIFPLSP